MKHWHRCRRWTRFGVACPFLMFEDHVEDEADPDDPPEDEPPEPVMVPERRGPPAVPPVPPPVLVAERRQMSEVVKEQLEELVSGTPDDTVVEDVEAGRRREPVGKLRYPERPDERVADPPNDRQRAPKDLGGPDRRVANDGWEEPRTTVRRMPRYAEGATRAVVRVAEEGYPPDSPVGRTARPLRLQDTPEARALAGPMPNRVSEMAEIAVTDELETLRDDFQLLEARRAGYNRPVSPWRSVPVREVRPYGRPRPSAPGGGGFFFNAAQRMRQLVAP